MHPVLSEASSSPSPSQVQILIFPPVHPSQTEGRGEVERTLARGVRAKQGRRRRVLQGVSIPPPPPLPHPPLALQHHLIFPSFNLARPPSIPLLHRRAQPHYILQEIIAFVWKECGEEGKGARTGSLCGGKRGSLKDNRSLLPSPASSSSFACSSCVSPPFHLLLAQPASLPLSLLSPVIVLSLLNIPSLFLPSFSPRPCPLLASFPLLRSLTGPADVICHT